MNCLRNQQIYSPKTQFLFQRRLKTEFSESSFGNINNSLECENQKLKENLAIELSHRKELEEKIDRLSSENQKIEQQQRTFKEISEQKSNTFIATINSLKQYCKQQNNNIQSDQEQYKKLISKILRESNSKIIALNAELEKSDQQKDSLITDKEKLTNKIIELEDEITKLKNIITKQEEESITLKSSLKQLLKL